MRQELIAISVIVLITGAGAPPLAAVAQQTSGNAPVEAAVIQQFQDRIEQYMALRRRLANEITGPAANSSAVQVTNASDALAAAIQRARPGKRNGSFFKAPTTAVLKRRLTGVVGETDVTLMLAAIDDDGPASPAPAVYRRFPTASQLATMPPSLLAVLPPLPKELEYRIVGNSLVLRDIDAALILDYIPSAVPR